MHSTPANDILVLGDLRTRRFFDYGLNLLSRAHDLAQETGGRAAAILMGEPALFAPAAECRAVEDPIGQCRAHGAQAVFCLTHPDLALPRADICAPILATFISERRPRLVLFPLTDFGRETAARIARIRNLGLIADCTDLHHDPDAGWVAACAAWGGQILADIVFSDPTRTGLITVQPHAFAARSLPCPDAPVETIPVEPEAGKSRLELIASAPESAEQRRLETAEVVVAGGAGLGSADGFQQIRELAAIIGGEVGASRPPVLNHWVAEERLIGQTGKTVRPRLLFSIGISGAVQYTAGTAEAGFTVAVNRDPNAPIFQTADIGIAADANALLPLLNARFKQTIMRRLADHLCDTGAREVGEGFGGRIQKLREGKTWSVADLAAATGQTPDFIQQVEANQTTPPVSFLMELARALGVDPGTFLHDDERTAIRDQRARAFIKRTKNYSYQTFTPGAENAHLRAFLVTIEPFQAHKPVAYKHTGEEFIYVMEGELEVDLDGKLQHLKPGETVHFNSEIPHKLKSLSSVATRFLDVLYTP